MNARTSRTLIAAAAVGATLALAPTATASVPAGTAAVSSPGTTAVAPAGVINHSCGPRVNPNRVSQPVEITHTTIGHARISLRNGHIGSGRTTYYWAKITGASVGNTVWMDWSDSPGSWHVCGPYKVHSGHDQHTLAVNFVIDSHNSREFRACGHHAGTSKCTKWVP
ncbi:hypothetical protein [Streptomyces sp. NPDC006012]|uniref:hypothetical protein n=1 Tax=Streptomyces sp. NPDC006012 TaxID=3364739 RepID=UPI0036852FFF